MSCSLFSGSDNGRGVEKNSIIQYEQKFQLVR